MRNKTILETPDKSPKGQKIDPIRETFHQNDPLTSARRNKEADSSGESYDPDLPVRCLGHNCEYVSYKDVGGKTALWCSRTNETVYNMKSCPFERWYRDDADGSTNGPPAG